MLTCETDTVYRCLFLIVVYVKLTTGYLQYFNERKTLLDAEKHCKLLGGHLLEMNSSETTISLNLNNNALTKEENFKYAWLWMSGCYDSTQISDSRRINTTIDGIPRCLAHCNGSRHVGLELDTCFCVSINLLNQSEKRHEKYCDRKCSFSDTEIRICGGHGRFSLYTIATEKITFLDMNEGEMKVTKCASLQYTVSGYNLLARPCNTRKYALCKNYDEDENENITFPLKTSQEMFTWNDAFYRACKKALAIRTGSVIFDNLQKMFNDNITEVWIGLIREDVPFLTSEFMLDKDKNRQEADITTKTMPSRQEWTNTPGYSSGYVCDVKELILQTNKKEPKSNITNVMIYALAAALSTIVIVGVITGCFFFKRNRHNSTRLDQQVDDVPLHQVGIQSVHATIDQSVVEDKHVIACSQLNNAVSRVEINPHYEDLDKNSIHSIHDYDLIKTAVTPKDNELQHQSLDNSVSEQNHEYDIIRH